MSCYACTKGQSNLNNKVLQVLEFDKIKKHVTELCLTPYGIELAEGLSPLPVFEEVKSALDMTEEGELFYRISSSVDLPITHDLRQAVETTRLGGVLRTQDLVALAVTARKTRQLARQIVSLSENYPQLVKMPLLCESLHIPRDFDDEVWNCLDENAEVLDRASVELRNVRGEIRSAQGRIKRTLEEMLRSSTVSRLLQENIVTLRGDRYCLAVRSDSQGQIRGVVHDVSASGATVFIEPERVVQLSNSLRQLENDERKEIEKVLIRLSGIAAGYADGFRDLFESLGTVDFTLAKAKYAHRERAVKPLVTPLQKIKIRSGRHPLLDKSKVVPLDIRLGDDFYQLVVTGPNTGGKTVAIKTVGVFVLMALSGLFVPALEGTEIGFFKQVFADIGDEQSIEQSLSTFSSHMVNIISILKAADEWSLLLFDELGAGTDPTEGAALAMAILDHLRERGIRTVATTHYSDLKAYAFTTPGTMNASVEFDVETLAPTYRLLMGVPGKSNAFAIASRLGLNHYLIQAASEKIAGHDARVEDLIAKLQMNISVAEKEASALSVARLEAERSAELLRKEQAQEEQERDSRKRKVDEELRVFVRQAQREVEGLLGELREMKSQGKSMKDHELTDVRKRLEKWIPETELRKKSRFLEQGKLQSGDEVKVLSLGGQVATLLEKTSENEWLVAIGVMKMKVQNEDLERSAKSKQVHKPTAMVRRTSESVKPEIDLRGTTVDEAMREVDQYLDKAVMAGYPRVTIIHGKGTGALRKGLLSYLRAHPHVNLARNGMEGEGGLGVTVVELK